MTQGSSKEWIHAFLLFFLGNATKFVLGILELFYNDGNDFFKGPINFQGGFIILLTMIC